MFVRAGLGAVAVPPSRLARILARCFLLAIVSGAPGSAIGKKASEM